jgi:proteasome lid subunit RPN8/RPN11
LGSSLAAAAFESSKRFSRGGLEIGGVLAGTRTDRGLFIEQWLPIECDHAHGPAFLLSERDQEILGRGLADAQRSGLEVIGWFVSHSRSALALSNSDRDIFERFFPHPWQITLVIKPGMDASARARICSRTDSGIVSGPEFRLEGFAMALPNPGGESVKETRPVPRSERSDGTHRRKSESLAASEPVVQPASRDLKPPRFQTANPASGSTRWGIVAVATLCLLVVAALMFARNSPVLLSKRTANVGLRAIATGGLLRVEWNAASPPVREAEHATVEVNDGGKGTKLLLNRNHLRMGSFEYVRQSNDVEFVFTLHHANQASVQEWTRFINAADPAPVESSAPSPPLPDRITELETENKRLQAALAAETARRVELEQAMRILRQHLGFK